ncbi:MAG: hypothetical protein HY747_00015 [Elusimicrobia bacterium]|nr:hypothetical protein [Elusimicrobiota bacterium]
MKTKTKKISSQASLASLASLALLASLAFSVAAAGAESRTDKRVKPRHPVYLYKIIDIPTAEVLDYGSFSFASRFQAEGGLLPSIAFGVFQRLMIGASLELDNYIGHGDIDLQRPELQLKFRFYDGTLNWPALAIGYDSQGNVYDKTKKKYLQEERGLYLAMTQEILTNGLEWTNGVNVSNFDEDAVRAFTSLSWIAPGGQLGLAAEYDNIQNTRWNRLNAGMNIFLSPFIHMGFHVRDILGTKTEKDSTVLRRPERIIDIRYITSF